MIFLGVLTRWTGFLVIARPMNALLYDWLTNLIEEVSAYQPVNENHCGVVTEIKQVLFPAAFIGHLHDDVILLPRPESFRILFSCALGALLLKEKRKGFWSLQLFQFWFTDSKKQIVPIECFHSRGQHLCKVFA